MSIAALNWAAAISVSAFVAILAYLAFAGVDRD